MTFLAIRLVAYVLCVLHTIYGTKCKALSRNYEPRLWLQLRILSIYHKLEEILKKK
jgi:hypothetical protein